MLFHAETVLVSQSSSPYLSVAAFLLGKWCLFCCCCRLLWVVISVVLYRGVCCSCPFLDRVRGHSALFYYPTLQFCVEFLRSRHLTLLLRPSPLPYGSLISSLQIPSSLSNCPPILSYFAYLKYLGGDYHHEWTG